MSRSVASTRATSKRLPRHVNARGTPGSPRAMAFRSAEPDSGAMRSLTNAGRCWLVMTADARVLPAFALTLGAQFGGYLMKIGVIGSGNVGQVLASGLIGIGHEVKIGSREPDSDKLKEWKAANGNMRLDRIVRGRGSVRRADRARHALERHGTRAQARRQRHLQRQDGHRRHEPARVLGARRPRSRSAVTIRPASKCSVGCPRRAL